MGALWCCEKKSSEDEYLVKHEPNTYIGARNFMKQRHGNGIYYYANGDVYEGEWKKDKKNGYGKYKYKDGRKMVGYFKKDEYMGPSIGDSNSRSGGVTKFSDHNVTKPLLDDRKPSLRTGGATQTDGRSQGYGATEDKPRRLIDPRNSLVGLSTDELLEKQREDEVMREKSKLQRAQHRKSVDIIRSKYNLPDKRNSLQPSIDKRNSLQPSIDKRNSIYPIDESDSMQPNTGGNDSLQRNTDKRDSIKPSSGKRKSIKSKINKSLNILKVMKT